jgi:hypothetical protein
MSDARATVRSFHFSAERLPAERVSVAGKGALRHLLHAALEFLHHERNLPYVHRWHFPDGRSNLFAFRIDTDGSPQNDIDDLYRLAREHDVPLTWFLDVAAHEPWLRHFTGMVGQEFGVHCYNHVELADGEIARSNLQRARHAMQREGLGTEAFAAPYGLWNPGVARVIDDLGFRYSSEFSFAYDTVPLYPGTPDRTFNALQVPIHPVSVGSMRRVGYSPDRMMQYFAATVLRKRMLGEPLFFYHHPTHRRLDVIASLFALIKTEGIDAITLGEYAQWWREREQWKPEITIADGEIRVAAPVPGSDRIQLAVSISGGRSALLPGSPVVRLAEVRWDVRSPVVVPGELARTREFDPRALLGEVFTTLSRKFK